MTPPVLARVLVFSTLAVAVACGQADLVVDHNGEGLSVDEARLGNAQSDSTLSGETQLDDAASDQTQSDNAVTENDQTATKTGECAPGPVRFVGWETRVDVRGGPVTQSAPQLVSSSYMVTGVANTPHTNNTPNPIQVQTGASVCVTTMGSATISSSATLTTTSTIGVPGLSVAVGASIMAGVAQTFSVSTCMTTTCHQTHPLAPGEQLFCTTFQGMETSTYQVKRYQEVTRVTQHRKVYERLTICVPGGPVYGPWIDGSTTVTREELPPISIQTTLPFVKTKCQPDAYPLTP